MQLSAYLLIWSIPSLSTCCFYGSTQYLPDMLSTYLSIRYSGPCIWIFPCLSGLLWCGLWYAGSRKLAFLSKTLSPWEEKAPPHALLCQYLNEEKHRNMVQSNKGISGVEFLFAPNERLTAQVSAVYSKIQRCKRFGGHNFPTWKKVSLLNIVSCLYPLVHHTVVKSCAVAAG